MRNANFQNIYRLVFDRKSLIILFTMVHISFIYVGLHECFNDLKKYGFQIVCKFFYCMLRDYLDIWEPFSMIHSFITSWNGGSRQI